MKQLRFELSLVKCVVSSSFKFIKTYRVFLKDRGRILLANLAKLAKLYSFTDTKIS